jgi:hypothetical protein
LRGKRGGSEDDGDTDSDFCLEQMPQPGSDIRGAVFAQQQKVNASEQQRLENKRSSP